MQPVFFSASRGIEGASSRNGMKTTIFLIPTKKMRSKKFRAVAEYEKGKTQLFLASPFFFCPWKTFFGLELARSRFELKMEGFKSFFVATTLFSRFQKLFLTVEKSFCGYNSCG
jgi:hypothetical protein